MKRAVIIFAILFLVVLILAAVLLGIDLVKIKAAQNGSLVFTIGKNSVNSDLASEDLDAVMDLFNGKVCTYDNPADSVRNSRSSFILTMVPIFSILRRIRAELFIGRISKNTLGFLIEKTPTCVVYLTRPMAAIVAFRDNDGSVVPSSDTQQPTE